MRLSGAVYVGNFEARQSAYEPTCRRALWKLLEYLERDSITLLVDAAVHGPWVGSFTTEMAATAAVDVKERSGILQGRGWQGRNAVFPASAPAVGDETCVATIPNGLEGDTSPVARAGDMIIVQERYDSITYLVLSVDGILHNRYGRFLHSDVIGKQLGLRWEAIDVANNVGRHKPKGQSTRGFIYALAPTPALWSMAMYHRTQVVYPTDSAIISLYLDLRPGSVLVESGTGAGSASVAFARTVAPHGRVMTFEFHKDRAEAARAEFESLGLSDVICVHPGHDVLALGFNTVSDGSADAVFLDLPAPYDVIAEAARVLRPDGTLCSFSPCIEQVQRTCEQLRAGPFHSVRTVTAPTKTYETRLHTLEAPGFDKLHSEGNGADTAAVTNGHATERTDANASAKGDAGTEEPALTTRKRKRVGSRTAAGERTALQRAAAEADAQNASGENSGDGGKANSRGLVGRVVRPTVPIKSRAFPEMKGHTSYLTFARRTREKLRTPQVNGDEPGAPIDGPSCHIV